jgi:Raf kinase inhibitor-like YbhB/YbcL family protein
MKLASPAFTEGARIPGKYSCEGENISPPLVLSGVPKNAKSIALVMEDPDAPMGTFVHWVAWDIPASMGTIPEGARPGVGGAGTMGRAGYHGPCPPPGHGPHRYFFRIYALDVMLGLPASSGRAELDSAMKGHILAEAHVMGTYERS